MVILDTNIIIDHLRQPKKAESQLVRMVKKNPKELLAISTVTIQELYEGKSTADDDKERQLLAVVTPLKILSYSYEIAKLAGTIARDLPRPIELADAAIAATAILNNAALKTLNRKDFAGIGNLELL